MASRHGSINVEQWRLFVQVAESGSLTKAAASRNTVQPVISRQIALLEEQCKGRLFDRTGRGVALTEAGKRILPRVKAWLNEAEQLADDVKATIGVPVGIVRVGMLRSIGDLLARLLFQRVRARFPGIQLRIVDAPSGQLSEWLKTGHIDVAILFRYARETGAHDFPLASVDTFLVGPAHDGLTRSANVSFSKLDGLPLILPSEPNTLRRLLDQLAQRKKISLSVAMECDSLAMQKDVVADGGGYAILGSHAMVEDLVSGRLQASRIVNPTIERTMTLCTSRYREPTLACTEVTKLVHMCIDEIAGSVAWKRKFSTGRKVNSA
jgi:LysR family nitrogen assimilation transcriptional regulator